MKTSFLKLFFAVYGVAVFGMDGDDDIGKHASASDSDEDESIRPARIDTDAANQIRDDALYAQQLAATPERRLKNESKVPQNRFGVTILMRTRILGLTTKGFHGEWI
jgi:hypothetical protein